MADNSITAEVNQFITDHIGSIEQLEILCLFAENPEKSWTVNDVFRNIQSTEKSVFESIRYFTAQGILTEAGPAFCLKPKNQKLETSVKELARTYRERRVKIIELIYKKPSAPAQHFAEAFRLRKEK